MSIHDTVATGLRNQRLQQHAAVAEPVVTALVQREQGIADALITAAKAQGLSEDQVRTALADAGMHVSAGADQGDLAARVGKLEEALQGARRRFGF